MIARVSYPRNEVEALRGSLRSAYVGVRQPCCRRSRWPGQEHGSCTPKLHPPGDVISFDAALSGGTIHLGSTLDILQTVTIDSSSLATPVTISGDSDQNGTGDEHAILFSIQDTPLLRVLDKYREEAYTENDGHQVVSSVFVPSR
jgi:hypothetical protein